MLFRSELDQDEIDRANDTVREEWESENGDDLWQQWLRDNDINTMYDWMRYVNVHTNRSLDWPYFTESSSYDAEVTYDDVADIFTSWTGWNARVGRNYHNATRDDTTWILEPDGSLNQPDSYEDGGLELVSPPMLLDDALAALETVFKWAKKNHYYTNDSTGFHIGVSVPNQTMENINHLKLILLLGDNYVLDKFKRLNSQ